MAPGSSSRHDIDARNGGAIQWIRWRASLLVGWATLYTGEGTFAALAILLAILIGV